MAVREFDAVDDDLVCATGSVSGMTYGTVVALFKLNAAGDNLYRGLLHFHNSSGTFTGSGMYFSATGGAANTVSMHDGTNEHLGVELSTGVWYLVVARKATGTATARFSVFNYNTTTWGHQNGSGSLADWGAPGASGTLRFAFQNSSDWFTGRIAARAVWANAVHWSADSTGDALIEAAGLEDAAQNWFDESPSAMWRFNQDSTSTAVTDDTGNGADQSSITGTTVVTGDDPPGFDFTLGGGGGAVLMPRAVIVAG